MLHITWFIFINCCFPFLRNITHIHVWATWLTFVLYWSFSHKMKYWNYVWCFLIYWKYMELSASSVIVFKGFWLLENAWDDVSLLSVMEQVSHHLMCNCLWTNYLYFPQCSTNNIGVLAINSSIITVDFSITACLRNSVLSKLMVLLSVTFGLLT